MSVDEVNKRPLAAVIAAISLFLSVGNAGAVVYITNASMPFEINQPGYYVLSEDILNYNPYNAGEDYAIKINSSDVVLDGQWHVLGGDGSGKGIEVEGSTNVTIKNIVLEDWEYGIYFFQVDNGSIENVVINGGDHAIVLDSTTGTVVDSVSVSGTTFTAIEISDSSGNQISNCTIADSTGLGDVHGISLSASDNNVIQNNVIYNHDGSGVEIRESSNNVVRQNVIEDCTYGVRVEGSSTGNSITDNVFTNCGVFVEPDSIAGLVIDSNTVNGKPLLYLEDVSDYVVSEDIGELIAVDCNNIVVRGQEFSGTVGVEFINVDGGAVEGCTIHDVVYGIYVYNSSYVSITGNEIHDSEYGIYMESYYTRSGNLFTGFVYTPNYNENNTIANNRVYSITGNCGGIYLHLCRYCNVTQNEVYGNLNGGIYLVSSPDNVVRGNKIYGNIEWGLYIDIDEHGGSGGGNLIYDNYFDNVKNASVSTANTWNVTKREGTNIIGGSYIGGNAWLTPSLDGWSQTCGDDDGDGICDVAYQIDDANVDWLPLHAGISAQPAQPTLSLESFEGAFPPANWTLYRLNPDCGGWVKTDRAHTGSFSAFHNYADAYCDDWLVSPRFVVPQNAVLRFYEMNENVDGSYHGVWISTGSGNPADGDFVKLQVFGEPTGYESPQWVERTIDLSAYAGQEVYIAFVYQGSDSKWYVDDVEVSGEAPPPEEQNRTISGYVFGPPGANSIPDGAQIVVLAFDASPYAGTLPNIVSDAPVNSTILSGFGYYSMDVTPGEYYVVAYLDANGNGVYDQGELIGYAVNATDRYSVTIVDATSDFANANITLGDYFDSYYPPPFEGAEGEFWCYPEDCDQGSVNVTVVFYNFSSSAVIPDTVVLTNFDPVVEEGYIYTNTTVRSGENYTVTFPNVHPGTYMLGYSNRTIASGAMITVTASLEIPEEESYLYEVDAYQLPHPRVVTVTVLNSGSPIVGASVIVYNPETMEFVGGGITDGNGRVDLVVLEGTEGAYNVDVFDNLSLRLYTFRVELNDSVAALTLDVSSLPKIYGYVMKGDAPIARASVSVYGEHSFFGFGQTDGSGYYEVSVPSEGEYSIVVEPGASGVYFPVYRGAVSTDSNPNNVSVGIADAKRIYGYVTDSSGQGIPDVFVWAYSEDTFFYAENVTDGSGYYELEVAPNGTYRVFFEPPYDQPGYTSKEVVVTVGSDDVERNVQLTAGYRLYGYVTQNGNAVTTTQPLLGWVVAYGSSGWYYAEVGGDGYYEMYVAPGTYTVEFYPYDPSLSTARVENVVVTADRQQDIEVSEGYRLVGRVTDGSGNPIGYVDVVLYNATTHAFAGWSATDANGEFEIRGLENGSYVIEVYSPSAGYYSGNVTVAGDTEITVTISGGYSVSGTVLPAGHAEIYLYNEMYAFGTETTDGQFSLAGVPEGSYEVYVYHYDLGIGRSFGTVSVPLDGSLNLDFGVEASSMVTVSGYVLDEDGNGIQNAVVNFVSASFGDSVTTDSNGYFTIQIPAGTYNVIAYADGYSTNESTYTISSNTTISVTLQNVTAAASHTLTLKITSNYDGSETVWITIKSIQNASINYADVVETSVSPGQNTVQISLPSGDYKIAVLYPIYTNGQLTGTGEVYEFVTVPGEAEINFTIPQ